MVSLVALVLLQAKERTIHDTGAWKLYAAEVANAQMLEARWSVSESKSLLDKYVLYIREPGMARLDQVGKTTSVWNGSAGIWIDHSKRVYMPLVKKPEFSEAAFFELTSLMKGKWNVCTYNLKESNIVAGGRNYNLVAVTDHLIDAMKIFTYTFSEQSKLLVGWRAEYRGMFAGGEKDYHYSIEKLDLYAMIDRDLFSLDPPAGYTGIGLPGPEGPHEPPGLRHNEN